MLARERNGGLTRAQERGLGLERPPPKPMNIQYEAAVRRWGDKTLDDSTLDFLKTKMGNRNFELYQATIAPKRGLDGQFTNTTRESEKQSEVVPF